jgi:cyclic pyranopterin phosphate synthase
MVRTLNSKLCHARPVPTVRSLPLLDTLSRPLQDLRISVTDRCNLRCTYCMPRELFGPDHKFLPREMIMSYEEMCKTAVALSKSGLQKIRLTGGEPLLRRDVSEFVAMLRHALGPDIDIAMTTNGILLPKHAEALANAGLSRVTVSLDAVDEEVFSKISDTDISVSAVHQGIDAAIKVGLPVKVNAVIRKGVNEEQLLPLAEHFRGTGIELRFIEFMDVGTTNEWKMEEVMTAAEMIEIISEKYPITQIDSEYAGQVAKRWKYLDQEGHIGFITSVSQPFCGDCCRARLSVDGKLYTCLFSSSGHELLPLIRSGISDQELQQEITNIWQKREDRYSELRNPNHSKPDKVEMSYIGG